MATKKRKPKPPSTRTLQRDERGHDRVRFSESMRVDTKDALEARARANARSVNAELHQILNRALGLVAAGWTDGGLTEGGEWTRPSRKRAKAVLETDIDA